MSTLKRIKNELGDDLLHFATVSGVSVNATQVAIRNETLSDSFIIEGGRGLQML